MNAGELFENAILNWRDKKGIGTALIPPPLNDKVMVLGVLQRVYSRSPTANVIILANNFTERIELIEFLTQQENEEENNKEFKSLLDTKKLKVLTYDFVEKHLFINEPLLCIMYRCDKLGELTKSLFDKSKFKLVVLNNIIKDVASASWLYLKCPMLESFKQNEIDAIRTSTPVEDIWIDVTIPEDTEEYKLLKYYDEYITTSLNIFGSFDIMQQARMGNMSLNISSSQICAQIAEENGWNEHLDMSVELNVQLDALYNPGNIKERASTTYEIIRNRAQLLSDYKGKCDKILDIVKDNPDAKILIINKRGEFASKVTDFINNMSDTIICGNYHDKVEPIPAVDINGKPIFYKSGPRKGERRTLGADAQKSLNNKLYNLNKLRVLSTNNAPDKSLNGNVDIIIITSPQCEEIESYLYRFTDVYIPSGKLKLYSIYIKNSLEESKINSKLVSETHSIVNNCENSVVSENNSDFVIVD